MMKVTTPTTSTQKKSLAFKALTTARIYCLNKVNLNPKLQNSRCCSVCKLRPRSVYTQTQLLSVNANPKLQNSHCCSVCKLRPKSVYTQTQLCINSDPNLCILGPNSVSTQTQICTKSELRSCVKAEVDVPHLYNSHYGLLDVKQHLKREEKKYIYINSEKSRAFISKISLLYRVSLICSLASEDIKQKDS